MGYEFEYLDKSFFSEHEEGDNE